MNWSRLAEDDSSLILTDLQFHLVAGLESNTLRMKTTVTSSLLKLRASRFGQWLASALFFTTLSD